MPQHEPGAAAPPTLPQPLDHPPRRGIGSDTAEEIGLLAQNSEIGEAVTAIHQRDRKVTEHGTGIMLPLTRKDVCQFARQCSGETRAIRQLVGKQAPRMAHHALTIGTDLGAAGAGRLHSQGALLFPGFRRLQRGVSLVRQGTLLFEPSSLRFSVKYLG